MQRTFYFLSGLGLGILIDIPLLILFSFGGPIASVEKAQWVNIAALVAMIAIPLSLGFSIMRTLGKQQGIGNPSIPDTGLKYSTLFKIIGFLFLPIIGFVLAWLFVHLE